MNQQLRPVFWLEAGLSLLSAVLLVATVVWKDWIEIVLRVDRDAGSGALEWAIVAVTLVGTMLFFVLARSEWQRARLIHA